jgi:hypothetical protein
VLTVSKTDKVGNRPHTFKIATINMTIHYAAPSEEVPEMDISPQIQGDAFFF